MTTDPDRLEWDALVSEGRKARESADSFQWILGDLAAKVETVYGDKTLARFAEQIGVSAPTLDDYRRVSRRFVDRSRDLPWTVYRAVGRVPEERVAEVLERADAGAWGVARTLREVQAIIDGDVQPVPERERQGVKKNLGMKASSDPIVSRFRSIADAFESLKEDEERESAEPEQVALSLTHERRREVERAVQRATQFVDRWVSILEIDPSTIRGDEAAS